MSDIHSFCNNKGKGIFEITKFKYIDISDWDVSNVIEMEYMFYDCKSFNQDLSGWNVRKVSYINHIFDNYPIKDEYKPKFK